MDSTKTRTARLFLAILCIAAPTTVCLGQTGSGHGLRAPVAVTAVRNLEFTTVFPGVNETIAVTDLTAGKWLVTGDPGLDVDLTFPGLPATLLNGVVTIPIVYAATDAAYHTSDDPGAATAFDPAVGTTATLSGTGELYVWIGGTVQPDETATAGVYGGTVTLDAIYH